MKGIHTHHQLGFSLVEISIVLLVVSLIGGGLLYGFTTYYKQGKYSESAANLKYSKNALLKFAYINGYLPCPDTNGDGLEDRTTTGGVQVCTGVDGTLPYRTLGVSRGVVSDGWGNLITYHITRDANAPGSVNGDPATYSATYFNNNGIFTQETPPTATASDANNLTVRDAASGGNVLLSDISVVIVAPNSNGKRPCATLAADEQENCDNDQDFVYHDRTKSPFFDDQLMTISGYELKRDNDYIPDVFLSLFKGSHTQIAQALHAAKQKGVVLASSYAQRIKAEDRRLYGSEQIMFYDKEKCAVPQDVFTSTSNFSIRDFVDSTLALGSGDLQENLKVNGDIQPTGIVLGGDPDNAVFVGGDMFGKIQLGNGNNSVVIAGDAAGYVIAGDDKDTLRICGQAVKATYNGGSVDLSPIELQFFYDNIDFGVSDTSGQQPRWVYRNVATNADIDGTPTDIDAVVQVVDHAPGFKGVCEFDEDGYFVWDDGDTFCLYTIDSEGNAQGNDEAIQPVYFSRTGLPANTPIWLDIRVSLYQHVENGTTPTVPVAIPLFRATAVDLDAWDGPNYELPKQFEYAWFYDALSYTTENPTYLGVTVDGNIVKARAIEDAVTPDVTVTFTETMITTNYNNASTFKYRIGLDLEEDLGNYQYIGRINSIWFGQPAYKNENTVEVAGNVDLGAGNDEVLIGGDTDRDTYLGPGDNYAYFFANSRQKVIGSDGDDNVVALGDLGYPAPDENSQGWDLKNGNNSARVKGTCYAPILVGSGDDLFIIEGDAKRDCALNTDGGSDIIDVGGTIDVAVDTGVGNDMVIAGDLVSGQTVTLGDGDDYFQMHNLLKGTVQAGTGDDYVVLNNIDTTTGSVDGGDGTDTLELKLVDKAAWDAGIKNYVSGFEKVILSDDVVNLP